MMHRLITTDNHSNNFRALVSYLQEMESSDAGLTLRNGSSAAPSGERGTSGAADSLVASKSLKTQHNHFNGKYPGGFLFCAKPKAK